MMSISYFEKNSGVNHCILCELREHEKIIHQTSHFISFFDYFPVIEGHILIATKDHKLSLAQIPQYWHKELSYIKKETVLWMLNNGYDNPFYFEHGTVKDNTSGTCIAHAHLHLIPAKIPVEITVEKYISNSIQLYPISMVESFKKVNRSYLYYEDSYGLGFYIYPEKPIPQQLIRQVVAEYLNLSDWDWKKKVLTRL